VQPGLKDVQDVLGNRRLVLILDELEQGVRQISDPAVRAQNIAFLQMLSEWSHRSDQLTVFASVYTDTEEPGATLKRVQPCRVNFVHAQDKARVVLHRLFEDYLDFKPENAASVVDSFINVWRRHITFSADEYRSKFLTSYPFAPELLELMLDRVPARGGFQGVRGALGFLGNMVRLSHKNADIVTAAHAALSDREVTIRLGDLDTSGHLVSRAISNLNEIRQIAKTPLAADVAATVLLYTLTGSGRTAGASRDEILKHVMRPGVDINEFERTLLIFPKYASNFHYHREHGLYCFDLEENSDAKVEYQSLKFEDSEARTLLRELWRDEIFREPNCVIYGDLQETKEALEALDRGRLRYVLAPRRLTPQERHDLYHGLSVRNLVILLEPRDDKFNLDTNQDILKWAKRQKAARNLADSTADAARRAEYERLGREAKRDCADAIKRAGFIYIRWETYGKSSPEDIIEEETIPGGGTKDDVLRHLGQQLYPTQLFEEHILPRLKEFNGQTIKEVDQQYRNTLTFPVPTTVRSVSDALRNLCRNSRVGIRHPRGNFCGETIHLTETELFTATVDEPFAKPIRTTVATSPVATQGKQPDTGTTTPPMATSETDTAPTVTVEEIGVPPQPGSAALRQEVAARLQEWSDPRITKIVFTLYLVTDTGDLSTLPAGLRGSLSGKGSLTAEINITREGPLTKAEVERLIDSLPVLPHADYSARLDVVPSEPR
jgi:hypothetical protein